MANTQVRYTLPKKEGESYSMKQPSLFRRFTMWVVDSWRVVMDARFNPLKYIPDPSLQTYFTLVLFTMWSVYFGFLATYYMGWLNMISF